MLTSDFRLNDAVVSGVAGAVALTAVHQAARAFSDTAPRMDVLGVRALARGSREAGVDVPESSGALYNAALAGDLLCNSAYYAMATNWTRGAALGLLAGVGALTLPQRMGLGDPPHSEHLSNKLMTVAWYLIGGLAAAATAQWLARKRGEENREFVGGY